MTFTRPHEGGRRGGDLQTLTSHFPRADCMATPATDFRYFRLFRSLTNQTAMFTVWASHAATFRIPAFPFLIYTHGFVPYIKDDDCSPELVQGSLRRRLRTFRYFLPALCRIGFEKLIREEFHVRRAASPACRSRPALPGRVRRHDPEPVSGCGLGYLCLRNPLFYHAAVRHHHDV